MPPHAATPSPSAHAGRRDEEDDHSHRLYHQRHPSHPRRAVAAPRRHDHHDTDDRYRLDDDDDDEDEDDDDDDDEAARLLHAPPPARPSNTTTSSPHSPSASTPRLPAGWSRAAPPPPTTSSSPPKKTTGGRRRDDSFAMRPPQQQQQQHSATDGVGRGGDGGASRDASGVGGRGDGEDDKPRANHSADAGGGPGPIGDAARHDHVGGGGGGGGAYHDDFDREHGGGSISPTTTNATTAAAARSSTERLFDPQRTAEENKSMLCTAEFDRMGMGRYQWFVFFLCGFGYFIDLLWAQAIGLITVPLENETGFGAEASNIGTLATSFNVGLTVGAFTWGVLVDIVGRRWSFYLTTAIAGVFGIVSGAPDTFTGLRVLVALVGFGVGGNIPVDALIVLETLPTNRRFLLALLSLFQPLGVLVASGLCYAFIPRYSCGSGESTSTTAVCTRSDNAGWRYTLHTLGAITLGVFLLRFLVFRFQESPAYLINRGRDRDALRVVRGIARVNGAPAPKVGEEAMVSVDRRCEEQRRLSKGGAPGEEEEADAEGVGPARFYDDDEEEQRRRADGAASRRGGRRGSEGGESDEGDEEQGPKTLSQTARGTMRQVASQLGNVKLLFRDRIQARITVLLWITFIADFMGFNIAGVWLPLILRDRGAAENLPLSVTYRNYVIIYAPGIAACALAAVMIEVPTLGRQWAMVVSSSLMAVSMFLYTTVTSQAGSVGLNVLEYFMQSMFNAILYAFVPEVYPSAIRGTAAGITSTLGRIAGVVAPLIGNRLYAATGEASTQGAKNVLYFGAGVTLAAPVALALLPFDTKGRRVY